MCRVVSVNCYYLAPRSTQMVDILPCNAIVFVYYNNDSVSKMYESKYKQGIISVCIIMLHKDTVLCFSN